MSPFNLPTFTGASGAALAFYITLQLVTCGLISPACAAPVGALHPAICAAQHSAGYAQAARAAHFCNAATRGARTSAEPFSVGACCAGSSHAWAAPEGSASFYRAALACIIAPRAP